MHAMTSADARELAAYRALGTVEAVRGKMQRPYPDDEGLAPMPYSDPAQESAAAYGDAWDDAAEWFPEGFVKEGISDVYCNNAGGKR